MPHSSAVPADGSHQDYRMVTCHTCSVPRLTPWVDADSVMAQAKRSKGEGMDSQKFRVGQKVRVEDVQEGIVTRVERGVIYVNGVARTTASTVGGDTRTITVLSEPKPDEPKLPGAVVRDAHGNTWSRCGVVKDFPWRQLGGGWDYFKWSTIDAVEILFPGVES